MSKLLQLRGGTTAEHASFTGAVREVTVDTTKDTLVVHDGSTAGGHALPRTAAEIVALISNDAIDSQHYAAGSIDTEHLAADVVTGAKIADNSIDSEHYVDGSVDDVHIAAMSSSKLTGALPAISGAALTGVQPFPSGTVMVFHQTAAPTGWTKSTTHNDKALRVVSGNGGGNGGTHALTSPPSLAHTHTGAAHVHSIGAHSHGNNLSAAAHTLTTAQMPSHNHTAGWRDYASGNGGMFYPGFKGNQGATAYSSVAIGSTGGGGSHSHGMSGSVSNSVAYNSSSAGGDATGSTTPTAFAPQYIDVIICAKD
jgi:hypothetical protein